MGTPADLVNDAYYRAKTSYYAFAMGGSVINGTIISGQQSALSVDTLRAHQMSSAAEFSVTCQPVGTGRKTSSISVKMTADANIPAGMSLLAVVVETHFDMVAVYGAATSNGQTFVRDVVRGILPDSFGTVIPAMGTGETASFSFSYTRDTAFQNADSLRLVLWLQDSATKTISSAYRTHSSIFPISTPIEYRALSENSALKIRRSADGILSVTPQCSGMHEISVFDLRGQRIFHSSIQSTDGKSFSINTSEFHGAAYVVRMKDASGESSAKIIAGK